MECASHAMSINSSSNNNANDNLLDHSVNPVCFSVVDLNIDGIVLLQSREYNQALLTFHRALRKLLAAGEVTSPNNHERNMHCRHKGNQQAPNHSVRSPGKNHRMVHLVPQAGRPMIRTRLRSIEAVVPPAPDNDSSFSTWRYAALSCQDDNVIRMFGRALHTSWGMDTDFLSGSHLLSGVLLYNIALSYHLMGLEGKLFGAGRNCSSEQFLVKAHEVYMLAQASFADHMQYHMLTLSDPNSSTTTTTAPLDIHMGILATLNNLSHIHAYFQDTYEAMICCQEMAQWIQSNRQTLMINGYMDEEMAIFLENACFVGQTGFHAAPSA